MQRKASLILMLLTSLMLGVTCTFGKADNPVNDPNINKANQVIDMLETFEAGVDAEAEARAAAAVRAAAAETHPYTHAVLMFDFTKVSNVDGTKNGGSGLGGRCSDHGLPAASNKSYLTVAAHGIFNGKCTDDTSGVGSHYEAVLSGAVDQKTGRINFHYAETWKVIETKGTGWWTVQSEIDFHGSEKDVVWAKDTVSGLASFTVTCDSNPERPQYPCNNGVPTYKTSGFVPFTLKFSSGDVATANPPVRPHFTRAVLYFFVSKANVEAGPRPPIASGCWPPQYPNPDRIKGYLTVDANDSIKGECASDSNFYDVLGLTYEGDLNGHVSTDEGHVDFELNVTINARPADGERGKIHYTISFNGNNNEYEWNDYALTGQAAFSWDCARLEGTRIDCGETAEHVKVTANQGRGTVPFVLQFYP
jgi:hypothetical protein